MNSTGDGGDICLGDEFADAGNGSVTLRSAIQEANVLSGTQKYISIYKEHNHLLFSH